MAGQSEGQQPPKRQRLSEGADAAATAAPASNGAPVPSAAAGAASNAAAAASEPPKLVVVWDLDETLLIFNSLLTGSFAAAQRRQDRAEALVELGRRWERGLLGLCDAHFWFEELEEYDQTCLADIQQFDDGASLAGYDWRADGFPPQHASGAPERSPERHAAAARPAPEPPAAAAIGGATPAAAAASEGSPGQHELQPAASGRELLGSPASRALDAAALRKLAYRYRRILKLCSFGLAALGTAAQRQEWQDLYADTDAATGDWLTHADALLAGCSSLNSGAVAHVAVTSGQLLPSLAKLLLFRLGRHIAPENVWSSRYAGKLECFRRVRRRYGPGCSYLVVGDGIEEDEVAAQLGLPYIRVLLAPAEHYPADRVASWRPEAATGGAGLPFTQLSVQHLAAAAGLGATGGAGEAPAEGARAGGDVAAAGAAAVEDSR